MKDKITARVSANIKAPVSKVWEALTKPQLIKQYFFGTEASSDWKVGSPITFKGTWEGKSYEDKGTILNIEPNKLIKYSYWSSMSGIEDKPENYVNISYELSEDINNNRTKLTIIQDNIPDEKMKKHTEENWKQVLDNLTKLLEKQKDKTVLT